MKILVTGGAGFIGSQVADRYIAMGHEVVIVDDLSTGKLRNVNPKAHFYHLDIGHPDIEDVFINEKPEIVNHHAAQIDVRKSVENPVFDAQVNILGIVNLLEKSIKYRVKRFIFASSGGAIYGDQPDETDPPDEDTPLQPVSPYGVAKAASELYLYYYQIIHKLNYIALRYGNVYGPRQDPFGEAGVVAIFTKKLLSGGQPLINGDGTQTRDYIFVDDVVEANVQALNSSVFGAFNIGTGVETNVNQLFWLLVEITGKCTPEVHGPPKPGEQKRSVLNCQRAHNLLKWSPKVSFAEGLRRTVEFFKNEEQLI